VLPLEPPASFHLRAAKGWLELGNHVEADAELDEIKPVLRWHPDVLDVRWHIYAAAKKWERCLDIANAMINLAPDFSEAWTHRSYALHELKRTQEAFDQLLPAAGTFPKVWTIPYNLACYLAQLGRLDESRKWLNKAMVADEDAVKRIALEDPDLKPLWESTSGTLWKGE